MDFVPFFWKLSIKLSSVAVAASLLWASGCNPLCVPSAGETTTERERRPPNWWLPGWNNTVHGWFIRWRRETRTSDDVHDPQEIEQQSNSSLVFFCLFHFFPIFFFCFSSNRFSFKSLDACRRNIEVIICGPDGCLRLDCYPTWLPALPDATGISVIHRPTFTGSPPLASRKFRY